MYIYPEPHSQTTPRNQNPDLIVHHIRGTSKKSTLDVMIVNTHRVLRFYSLKPSPPHRNDSRFEKESSSTLIRVTQSVELQNDPNPGTSTMRPTTVSVDQRVGQTPIRTVPTECSDKESGFRTHVSTSRPDSRTDSPHRAHRQRVRTLRLRTEDSTGPTHRQVQTRTSTKRPDPAPTEEPTGPTYRPSTPVLNPCVGESDPHTDGPRRGSR